jgi:ABC-type proline/glycine betaine transport system ATPase subunit
MNIPAQHRFYVYVLARPSNRPFYVGKGKGRRVFKHEAEARSGCTCHKCNIIRKIWRTGGEAQRSIVFTTDDEQEAFECERRLIALYGRKTLCNQTDGGDGTSGRPASDAVLRAVRERNQRRFADPEARAAAGALLRAARDTPEARAKMSEAQKRRTARPEERARLTEQGTRAMADPALRSAVSERTKRLWADPEWRAKMTQKFKDAMADPEARKRRSEQTKAFNAKNRP